MISVFGFFFFIFGLIIGSFLNVVIYRMNTARSLGGRSACMSCMNKLAWYELVPVFSFLGLQGRCRSCKTKISWQYPLVEFMTGIVFATLFFKFQDLFFSNTLIFIFNYFYYILMFSILIVITGYDMKHKIIPDVLSITFGALAFVGMFFMVGNGVLGFSFHFPFILEFFSGILIALPFYILWLVSRGAWMGLGDAKLALGLGWFLGLAMALSGIVLAFWIGTIIGLGLIVLSKIYPMGNGGYGMKSEIPFAPYLAIGAFIAFICELNLFNIYF